MDLLKKFGLGCVVFALNGCTVLGFATDMAIIGVSERNTKSGDQSSMNNHELFFTDIGLEHDVEAVKTFMEGLSDSHNDFTSDFQEDKHPKALACKSVEDGKQQFYPP
jgi:hypothetical protein